MQQPLKGRRILVTRPRHQVADLADPLIALGADVSVLSAIEILPPIDSKPLDSALRRLSDFDWIVLTSANGVEAVRSRLEYLGIPRDEMSKCRVAVIGPATGDAFAKAFRPADAMPGEYISEAIAETLGEVSGLRFLLARADLARRQLADILLSRDAIVEEVTAYRIAPPSNDGVVLDGSVPDAILLTSSAGVRGTRSALQGRGHEDWMHSSSLICIGPITAKTVLELGYQPAAIAVEYTVPGLLRATQDFFQGGNHV